METQVHSESELHLNELKHDYSRNKRFGLSLCMPSAQTELFLVQALVELLEEEKVQVPSWICFSSVDGKNLSSGESFADCLKILNASEKVAVVGVNCTPPQFIEGIICEFRKVCSHL